MQVHLPADALRVLPPSGVAETAVALAQEVAPEDGAAAVEVSTS